MVYFRHNVRKYILVGEGLPSSCESIAHSFKVQQVRDLFIFATCTILSKDMPIENIGKIVVLDYLYKEYQQRISWLDGNFYQAQHRANELAIAGELSSVYYCNAILPETQESNEVNP